MKSSHNKDHKKEIKEALNATVLGAAVAALLIGFFGYAFVYSYWYQGRIYPGVFVGPMHVGGLTAEAAQQLMTTKYDTFQNNGLTYTFNEKEIHIPLAIVSPTDPDLHYELISWQADETFTHAEAVGRTGNWFTNLVNPILVRVNPVILEHNLLFNYDQFVTSLKENISEFETPGSNPTVAWSYPEAEIIPEVIGATFDYTKIATQTFAQAQHFDSDPIEIALHNTNPSVLAQDIKTEHIELLTTLDRARPILSWRNEAQTWYYTFQDYKNNVVWERNEQGDIELTLNTHWLEEQLAPIKLTLDQPAQDAKFEIIDGRVTEFSESKDGMLLDVATNITVIQNDFVASNYNSELALATDYAKIQTADVNDLGISEIIGIGTSDFSGSPANRRHNISIGAASLNGLLIKPGEEFSLMQALLPIDETTDYLPELVIKGDRTIPEYGGGLCQIGTTAFRAALATGLEITERRNHSFRVRYYEPAGTDATLYDPAPDFKFINDTPGHILIQTRMDGDIMIFEFWGTPDGRIAETTDPEIYNITAPPPTKYVLTEDLPAGEINCTEKAHNGADASFDYAVTYADGTSRERTFTSHYRPWQAVCLVGQSDNEEANQNLLLELSGELEQEA